MKKTGSILFLCTGNSCRSQMAEGFARALFPKDWKIYSAGIVAAGINPLTIETMNEAGIDISGQHSKTLDEIPTDEIDYVITLCSNAQANCPIFPRKVVNEHWPIDDPVTVISNRLIKDAFRQTRDDIKGRVEDLLKRLKG